MCYVRKGIRETDDGMVCTICLPISLPVIMLAAFDAIMWG
jgi:hypothetical protein